MKNIIRIKLICAIFLIPALVLCGHAQRPAKKSRLAHDPLAMYPHEMYITSVGSGDTREIAQKKAIAGIARSIEVDIKSQQQLTEQYFETGTGQEMKLKKFSTFSRQLNLVTEQSLKNVTIGKTWFSKEDGRYQALAYMDRSETADIYNQELMKIDGEVSTYFKKSQEVSDKLTRLAYLNKALNLAAQRDVMAQQLTIISLGSESFTPTIKPPELVSARHELAKQIGVKLELDYAKWEEFENSVKEVLQAFGFQIVQTDPDILVSGKMSMERLERKGYFVRWFVELHFIDFESQNEFLTFGDDDREGHASFSEAERRAAKRVSGAIRDKLYQKLETYFDSLISVK